MGQEMKIGARIFLGKEIKDYFKMNLPLGYVCIL